MSKCIAILLLLFCIAFYAGAQEPFSLKYTTDNGLPSNVVYRIFSDSKKYLWFATDNGVARYNGSTFKYLTTKEGLPDNEIFNIIEDKDARIWFLPLTGFPVYYKDGKIYTPHRSNHTLKKPALTMITDPRGNLYVSAQAGYYKFIHDSLIYTAYHFPNVSPVESPALTGIDSAGNLWTSNSNWIQIKLSGPTTDQAEKLGDLF